jgi:hypothetical protein
MATRKRKVLRTETDVASIHEELANDSDSDADFVPEISSSEESDDENDISGSGPGPSADGFCKKKNRQPSIPLFTGNPAVQFAVQNGTDMMEYVDNYITPELSQIVSIRQIYTHNRSQQCHDPLLNMHVVNNGNM